MTSTKLASLGLRPQSVNNSAGVLSTTTTAPRFTARNVLPFNNGTPAHDDGGLPLHVPSQ